MDIYISRGTGGSSSLITDLDGNVAQDIEYVPFGEVFIEEKNSTWNTPYKFNGKELDEETGLYYYGARYMDPRTSVWISVDPLAEKHPNISAYVYCNANPIIYLDPDGNDWIYSMKNGVLTVTTNNSGNEIKFKNHEGRIVSFNSANLSSTYDSKMFISIIGDQLFRVSSDRAIKEYGYSPNCTDNSTVAFAVFETGKILLNTNRSFNNNMYELRSTLRHEYLHLKMKTESHLDHANVYLGQMGFGEFRKTSKSFQLNTVNQFAKRLMRELGNFNGDVDGVQKSINQFNDGIGKTTGFQLGISSDGGSQNNGVSGINVYYKGVLQKKQINDGVKDPNK